jgi:hypothetical protein
MGTIPAKRCVGIGYEYILHSGPERKHQPQLLETIEPQYDVTFACPVNLSILKIQIITPFERRQTFNALNPKGC